MTTVEKLNQIVTDARRYGDYSFGLEPEMWRGVPLRRFTATRVDEGVSFSVAVLVDGFWSSEYPASTEAMYDAVAALLKRQVPA